MSENKAIKDKPKLPIWITSFALILVTIIICGDLWVKQKTNKLENEIINHLGNEAFHDIIIEALSNAIIRIDIPRNGDDLVIGILSLNSSGQDSSFIYWDNKYSSADSIYLFNESKIHKAKKWNFVYSLFKDSSRATVFEMTEAERLPLGDGNIYRSIVSISRLENYQNSPIKNARLYSIISYYPAADAAELISNFLFVFLIAGVLVFVIKTKPHVLTYPSRYFLWALFFTLLSYFLMSLPIIMQYLNLFSVKAIIISDIFGIFATNTVFFFMAGLYMFTSHQRHPPIKIAILAYGLLIISSLPIIFHNALMLAGQESWFQNFEYLEIPPRFLVALAVCTIGYGILRRGRDLLKSIRIDPSHANKWLASFLGCIFILYGISQVVFTLSMAIHAFPVLREISLTLASPHLLDRF